MSRLFTICCSSWSAIIPSFFGEPEGGGARRAPPPSGSPKKEGMMADQLLQQIVNSLLIGAVYALVAIGLTLIWGVMNVLNFAHGDFLMLGMFIAFWCYTLFKMDPLFSIPVCAALLF